MFTRRTRALLIALGVLFLAETAQAQPTIDPPPSYFRPAVSPYLNLVNNRRGTLGVNYYNFVRPQFQFANALYQQQGQINRLQTGDPYLRRELERLPMRLREDLGPAAPARSDPPASFMNYSHYYTMPRPR